MSTTTNTPPVEAQIESHLQSSGRSTIHEIATAIGYSHGYVRQKAKEMRQNGRINGTKGDVIPGYIINGNTVVLTSDKQQIINALRAYAPQAVPPVQSMSISEAHKHIRNNVADATFAASRRWEFWA